MTNISLITTPDLTQDTMGKVAQCRTNIISIYRELTVDDRFETEPGASFPVNVMNQTLFELVQTMIGKDKEHATIAQSFLNCDRLMLDKLADMSFPQFSRICCHHFVGFKVQHGN